MESESTMDPEMAATMEAANEQLRQSDEARRQARIGELAVQAAVAARVAYTQLVTPVYPHLAPVPDNIARHLCQQVLAAVWYMQGKDLRE